MGVAVYRSSDVLIEHVRITRVYGDCVYLDYGYADRTWSSRVTFRDSSCSRTGRSGVAIVAGRHVKVARVRFSRIGMYDLNIEPNTSDGGGTYVTFKDNTIGTNGVAGEFGGHMVCTNGGAAGASIHHITITGNRARGETLSTYMWEHRNHDIVFSGNTSNVAARGPVVVIQNADRVRVANNTQPMLSGSFANFQGSTAVTYTR
jgi:hypothetical protein